MQGAAEGERDRTEQRQRIVAGADGGNALHLTVDIQVRVDTDDVRQAVEEVGLCQQVQCFASREPGPRCTSHFRVDDDEAVCIAVGQGAPQHRVHDAEHGGVRAYHEGQGGDDDE